MLRGTRKRAHDRLRIAGATHAALAVLHPQTGAPWVSRIALAPGPDGAPMSLVSTLAPHTAALAADPRAALLIGTPETRGDPLTYPRLTLQAEARFIARDAPDHADWRAHYLRLRPKAKLYIDFADFRLVSFRPQSAALNGGFGQAYALTLHDLGL